MPNISRTKTWNANETLTAADLNAEFNGILTGVNDNTLNNDNLNQTDDYLFGSLVTGSGLAAGGGDGKLHVHVADAGSVTAHASGNDFVIEGTANPGMSFLSGASTTNSIYFGDVNDNDAGSIVYTHGTDMAFTVETAEVLALSASTITASADILATSASANEPVVTLKNTNNGATSAYLKFINDKGAAGADNDVCGTITFYGDDDNQDNIEFARIEGVVADASNGDECGAIKLYVAENDGNNTVGLALTGSTTDGEVDVTVGAGSASVVTIPGHIDLAGDIDVDGTLEADAITIGGTAIGSIYGVVAGSSSIVTTGTIGTGVWQGTKVASAYLDDDTAHLSGTQTFSGAKTFSAALGGNLLIGGTSTPGTFTSAPALTIEGTLPTLYFVDTSGSADDVTIHNNTNHLYFYNDTDSRTLMTMAHSGLIGINETVNGQMTTGLTINQGVADDKILVCKSSDIGTGHTTNGYWDTQETDDYFFIQKASNTLGGVVLTATGENSASLATVNVSISQGGQADTAKSTSALGLHHWYTTQHDGANANVAVAANGNCFVFSARVSSANPALFVIDEDGDFHYNGADGGAFDLFEDATLLRAMAIETSDPATVVRSRFDHLVKYHKQDLIDAELLGYCSPEEEAEGHRGLVNGAQTQRALIGQAWQSYCRDVELKEELNELRQTNIELASRLNLLEN